MTRIAPPADEVTGPVNTVPLPAADEQPRAPRKRRRVQGKKRARARADSPRLFSVYSGRQMLGAFPSFDEARAFIKASASIASNKEALR